MILFDPQNHPHNVSIAKFIPNIYNEIGLGKPKVSQKHMCMAHLILLLSYQDYYPMPYVFKVEKLLKTIFSWKFCSENTRDLFVTMLQWHYYNVFEHQLQYTLHNFQTGIEY